VDKLPVVSAREFLKFLYQMGFVTVSTRGSHIKLKKDKKTVIVPNHHELDRRTLASALAMAGLGEEQFIKWWQT